MRLGWRNPRPNDYQGPDQRPLRDALASVQQYMTWPHFTASIDAQALSASFVKRTITAIDDPYSLIRSNDDIQVPRDFDTWMFIGTCGVLGDGDAAGRAIVGWFLNGTDVAPAYDNEYNPPAGAGDWRAQVTIVHPVKKGDVLAVGIFNGSGGGNVTSGKATGFFLPMT